MFAPADSPLVGDSYRLHAVCQPASQPATCCKQPAQSQSCSAPWGPLWTVLPSVYFIWGVSKLQIILSVWKISVLGPIPSDLEAKGWVQGLHFKRPHALSLLQMGQFLIKHCFGLFYTQPYLLSHIFYSVLLWAFKIFPLLLISLGFCPCPCVHPSQIPSLFPITRIVFRKVSNNLCFN